MADRSEIDAIRERLCQAIRPKRIYLFGSSARGDDTEESDYDFYLVVGDDAGRKIELLQKAYSSLHGMPRRPVDLVLDYESSFSERTKLNTLERTVVEEGILLYEAQ